MLRPLFCLAVLAAAVPSAFAAEASAPALPYTLPAKMVHHRFVVEARTPGGELLTLFTDTGGGMNLTTRGADKLGLAYDRDAEPPGPGPVLGTTTWPTYAGPWIPPPKAAGTPVAIMRAPAWMREDGMLGTAWFGDRTWEFDYRAGTLRLLADGALPAVDAAHRVALGFQSAADGSHATHFPRIPARVDGETLQFLFDTGATFRLEPAAAKALGDAGVDQRAGSFITASVMRRWRERHPDWPWLARGDGEAAMIQVPGIEVAGHAVGPVWFSERPDSAFHGFMAQWMDQAVDGALGGNAFRDFRITVDYPSAAATFER